MLLLTAALVENTLRASTPRHAADFVDILAELHSLAAKVQPYLPLSACTNPKDAPNQGECQPPSPPSPPLQELTPLLDAPEPTEDRLRDLLVAVARAAALVRPEHRQLIDTVLLLPWPGMAPDLASAVRAFIDSLVSCMPHYAPPVLAHLVSHFNRATTYDSSRVSVPYVRRNLHAAITRVLDIVPFATYSLIETLGAQFPHRRHRPTRLMSYIENSLRLYRAVPVLREQIMSLIIDNIVYIDSDIQCDIENLPAVGDEDEYVRRMEQVDAQEELDDAEDAAEQITSAASKRRLIRQVALAAAKGSCHATSNQDQDCGNIMSIDRQLAMADREALENADAQFTERAFDQDNNISNNDEDNDGNDNDNDNDDDNEIELNKALYDAEGNPVLGSRALTDPATSSNALAIKLDMIMESILDFISRMQTDAEIGELNRILLHVFSRSILRTFRLRRVQFLLFYAFSRGSPALVYRSSDEFLGLLANVYRGRNVANAASNDSQTQTQTQTQEPSIVRVSAALYIASFVARAAYVPPELVLCALRMLACHSVHFVDRNERVSVRPDAGRYAAFYAGVQAAMYIYMFRHDVTRGRAEARAALRGFERVVLSRFNPLKLLHPGVVGAFAALSASEDLLMCYPIIERNRRVHVADAPHARLLDFNSYFPFDEPSLTRSSRFLSSMWRAYEEPELTVSHSCRSRERGKRGAVDVNVYDM